MASLEFGLDFTMMTEGPLVHVQVRYSTSYLLGGTNFAWKPTLHKQEDRDPSGSSRMIGFVQLQLVDWQGRVIKIALTQISQRVFHLAPI
jgi:hypothetical protein